MMSMPAAISTRPPTICNSRTRRGDQPWSPLSGVEGILHQPIDTFCDVVDLDAPLRGDIRANPTRINANARTITGEILQRLKRGPPKARQAHTRRAAAQSRRFAGSATGGA